MASTDLLLTFNAGSSTVKIGIFAIDGARRGHQALRLPR